LKYSALGEGFYLITMPVLLIFIKYIDIHGLSRNN
jgi:hypothetical protein